MLALYVFMTMALASFEMSHHLVQSTVVLATQLNACIRGRFGCRSTLECFRAARVSCPDRPLDHHHVPLSATHPFQPDDDDFSAGLDDTYVYEIRTGFSAS